MLTCAIAETAREEHSQRQTRRNRLKRKTGPHKTMPPAAAKGQLKT